MKSDGWFATFTFLDCSGALSSSQWRRIAAAIAKVATPMARSLRRLRAGRDAIEHET